VQEITKHQQFQPEDRMTIANMVRKRYSIRAIGSSLCQSASTISREVGCHTLVGLAYGSKAAQRACQRRRQDAWPDCKGQIKDVLWDVVLTMLNWRWSLQRIVGAFHRMFPEDPGCGFPAKRSRTRSTLNPRASCVGR
jgi:IS30 family transposase